jgi:YHS domain-containing protein
MYAAALICAAATMLAVSLSAQRKPVVNTGARGELAVKGYDVVAYAREAKPVVGRAEFEYRWNGAVWRFSTAANRDAFSRDPEMYAPQFGGYCAYAVSRGYTADTDPEAWRIVDGKLYLNYSKRVQRLWEQDVRGNIAKGDANWPAVLTK